MISAVLCWWRASRNLIICNCTSKTLFQQGRCQKLQGRSNKAASQSTQCLKITATSLIHTLHYKTHAMTVQQPGITLLVTLLWWEWFTTLKVSNEWWSPSIHAHDEGETNKPSTDDLQSESNFKSTKCDQWVFQWMFPLFCTVTFNFAVHPPHHQGN